MKTLNLMGVCLSALLSFSADAMALVPTIKGELKTVYTLTYEHEKGGELCSADDYKERGGVVKESALGNGYVCIGDECSVTAEYDSIAFETYQIFYIGMFGKCTAKDVMLRKLKQEETIKGEISFSDKFVQSLDAGLGSDPDLDDVIYTGATQYGRIEEIASQTVNGVKSYMATIYYDKSTGTDVIKVAGKNVLVNYASDVSVSNSIYAPSSKYPKITVPNVLKKQAQDGDDKAEGASDNRFPKVPMVRFPTGQ